MFTGRLARGKYRNDTDRNGRKVTEMNVEPRNIPVRRKIHQAKGCFMQTFLNSIFPPVCYELPFMSDDFDANVTTVSSEWMSHTSSSREGKAAKYSFISGLAGSAMASTDRQPSTVPNTMFLPSSVLSIALSSACIRKLAIIFASEVLQMQQTTS